MTMSNLTKQSYRKVLIKVVHEEITEKGFSYKHSYHIVDETFKILPQGTIFVDGAIIPEYQSRRLNDYLGRNSFP